MATRPGYSKTSVDLPQSFNDELRQQAAEEGRSMAAVVLDRIRRARNGKTEPERPEPLEEAEELAEPKPKPDPYAHLPTFPEANSGPLFRDGSRAPSPEQIRERAAAIRET